MGYLLGVDAGLTVIKASLLDPAGAEIARAGVPAPAALPRPGAAERDLDVLWAATVQAVDACLTRAGVTGREVDAVGVTGHGDGIYLVDSAHRPIGPAILSTDTRGAARAAAVGTGRSAATLLRRAGELPRPGSTTALLGWLVEHDPDRLAAARWLLYAKDWLRLRLTGEVATDRTDASAALTASGSGRYDLDQLVLLGLPDRVAALLPSVLGSAEPAGCVTSAAAEATGLAAGTPVVAGCHDVSACVLGAGATRPGDLTVIGGTFAVNAMVVQDPVAHPDRQIRAFPMVDRSLVLTSSPGSAATLHWLLSLLSHPGADATGIPERIAEDITAVLADPSDVVLLPFADGGWGEVPGTAVIAGLSTSQHRGHVLRALLEGVALNHRRLLADLTDGSPPATARLCGGLASSPLWAQMMADALDVVLEVCDVAEAGTRGAALLAGVGVGCFTDLDEAADATSLTVARAYKPDPVRAGVLAAAAVSFDRWCRTTSSYW